MSGKDTMLNMIRQAVAVENAEIGTVLCEFFPKVLDILRQYLPQLANMQLVTDMGL